MPHVIVKLWPGKSDQQKQQLAERITSGLIPRRDKPISCTQNCTHFFGKHGKQGYHGDVRLRVVNP
jgi:hypothetical protein